jgi:hypothetical protein
MSGWMVFGKIISEIGFSRGPENFEMSLFDTVADPVELHVYGSRALLIDSVISDTAGGGIVSLDGCSFLSLAHFLQGGSKNVTLFGIDEEASNFCFGGQGHDMFDDTGDSEYYSVVENLLSGCGFSAEVDVAPGVAASFGDRRV